MNWKTNTMGHGFQEDAIPGVLKDTESVPTLHQ